MSEMQQLIFSLDLLSASAADKDVKILVNALRRYFNSLDKEEADNGRV